MVKNKKNEESKGTEIKTKNVRNQRKGKSEKEVERYNISDEKIIMEGQKIRCKTLEWRKNEETGRL